LPSVTSFRQPLASRMYCPASVTSRHLANYNDTDVLFGTHRRPHIVRPSRPHKFLFIAHRHACTARYWFSISVCLYASVREYLFYVFLFFKFKRNAFMFFL